MFPRSIARKVALRAAKRSLGKWAGLTEPRDRASVSALLNIRISAKTSNTVQDESSLRRV